MSKRTFFLAQAALLATAALLIAPEPSAAQTRVFASRGGGFTPYFFWPSLGGGLGNNYPAFGSYYPGNSYTPYYTSPSYYTTNYYSQPTYIFMPPIISQTPASSDSSYQGEPENAARIEIQVPPSADLWFDGKKTKQTGPNRNFATPPLIPGQLYSYDVRAIWKDDSGATVTRTRTIDIQAGQKAVVNMKEVDN